MFKNLTVYRVGPEWSATLQEIEDSLAAARFAECGATQPQSLGWIAPRGTEHAPLVESVGGQWLLALMIEREIRRRKVGRHIVLCHVGQVVTKLGRHPAMAWRLVEKE